MQGIDRGRFFRSVGVALGLLVAACTTPPAGRDDAAATRVRWRVAPLPSPAGPGAGEPSLIADGPGRLRMSWLEPVGDEYALRQAALSGGRWQPPTTVTRGPDLFVNWADFPSLARLTDGTLAVHWLRRSDPSSPYAYDVQLAFSHDEGTTWSAPFTPHHDGTATEHGFVSLVAEQDGTLSAVWLDGRNFASVEDPHAGRGEMTLRAARFRADGTQLEQALLDERTCDCCQTTAVAVGEDLLVAYRDRSPEEVRDIRVVRRHEGAWTSPEPLWEDGWRIPGCPVNGPAASARGGAVVVAWFALVDGAPEVKAAFSDDAGVTFGEPVVIAHGGKDDPVLGRVDVEWFDDHQALVTWMTARGEIAEIRYRTVADDGTLGPVQTLATTSAARASGFPRMAFDGTSIVVAWRVPDEPARIELAALTPS